MKNNRITIKNELPELLEAICTHPDCPEWLQDAIWESFQNRTDLVIYTASWWRSQFDAMSVRAMASAYRESHSRNDETLEGGVQ